MKSKISFFCALVLLSIATHAAPPSTGQVFVSKGVLELKMSAGTAGDEARNEEAAEFKKIQENLPNQDSAVSVNQVQAPQEIQIANGQKLLNPPIFEVVATGNTPEAAAERANQIMVSLQKAINTKDQTTPKLVIFQKALTSEVKLKNSNL